MTLGKVEAVFYIVRRFLNLVSDFPYSLSPSPCMVNSGPSVCFRLVDLSGWGFRWLGLSGWGFRWLGLSRWRFKWMRLQVGGAPLDKLSVVVPPVAANAAQTEI